MTGSVAEAVPDKPQAQSNRSVKRKPLSNRESGTFTQVTHQPLQNIPARARREEDQAIQHTASPVQAPPNPILSQYEQYMSPYTTATLLTDVTATIAPVQSSGYPVHVEKSFRIISANSPVESSAVNPPQHPPLRHAQTAPLPTLDEFDNDKTQRCSTSQPLSMVSMPRVTDRRKSASQIWSSSLETGKRLGASSLETGKRLAKNKYVRAGMKYTADLAIRTVVNGVVNEVLNNQSDSNNNNNDQPSDDSGPGVMDQLFNSAASGMMSSSPCPQTSQVDLSGLASPGLAFPMQPGFNTLAAFSGVANTTAMMDPFQQQQAAALGLSMALQQQNAAMVSSAQSAIQQSQQFQSDMQFQASKTLNFGTDATAPGLTANTYRSSAPTNNNNSSAAKFQQQLANAGAAV